MLSRGPGLCSDRRRNPFYRDCNGLLLFTVVTEIAVGSRAEALVSADAIGGHAGPHG